MKAHRIRPKKAPKKTESNPQNNKKLEINGNEGKIIDNHLMKKLKIANFGIIENITVEAKGDPS